MSAIYTRIDNIRIAKKLTVSFILIITLVGCAIGLLAYTEAKQTLKYQEEKTYFALVNSRHATLTDYLTSISQDLTSMAVNPATHQALTAFTAAWNKMGDNPTAALQQAYIEDNPNPLGEKHKLNVANTQSAYDAVHRIHHPWLRTFLEEKGYYDVFLIEPQGDLVYTVFKELDFATNLNTGEWKDTDLANAFRAAQQAPQGEQVFFDFQPYAPSHGAAASFIATPIFDAQGQRLGVLVFQMPTDRINHLMQVAEGMGETGETYIVGSDNLMRSDSRFSTESTILKTKVTGETILSALAGKTGAQFVLDYRGVPVLSAYKPLTFSGTTWAVLAEIDQAEILRPLQTLAWGMALTVAICIALASFIGYKIANGIARPVNHITAAVNQLAAGDTSQKVPWTTRQDEIGIMARALTQIQGAAIEAMRLKTMVDNMPVNVMMADPQTLDITYANKLTVETLRGLQEHLPVPVDDLVGTCLDVFHKHPEHQRKLLANPDNLPHQARITLGDDILFLNIYPIFDGAGAYMSAMLTWSVVTEERRIGNEALEVTKVAIAASQEVLAVATRMVTGTEESSKRTVAMAELANQTLDRITSVAAATEELSGSVDSVESQVIRSSEVANSAVDKAAEANERVGSLKEAANKIGNVISLIRDIAEQTNLLALNATIEAARAGEAGKGFAVVASEVKNLANQTTKATEEISAQITAIQEETEQSGAAILGITAVIQEIENITNEVRSAIEQQTEATREISANVQGSSAAMHELDEKVSEVVQRNLNSMGSAIQVIWQTEDLMTPMSTLETNVQTFLNRT